MKALRCKSKIRYLFGAILLLVAGFILYRGNYWIFTPHNLVVQTGQTIHLDNESPKLHADNYKLLESSEIAQNKNTFKPLKIRLLRNDSHKLTHHNNPPVALVTHSRNNKFIASYDLYKNANFISDYREYEFNYAPLLKERPHEKVTVYFIKHSHIDPGWLRTVDMYYDDSVFHILNNMLSSLLKYTNMTFIWAETVYFSRWWSNLLKNDQLKVRDLLSSGRLELVTGGWVMPDEACTHYHALIDQLVEGHQWLYHHLKYKPRHNWSVDPFGHSSTATYLWKLAGFEGMVVQRIHQAVKNYMTSTRDLQFYWRQNWDKDGWTDILTYTDPWVYYVTSDSCGLNKSFCSSFDIAKNAIDPGDFSHKEMKIFAELLHKQLMEKVQLYRRNTIFVIIGNDFQGVDSEEWEREMAVYGSIFEYLNTRPEFNIEVKYGTLKNFFNHFNQEKRNYRTVDNFSVFKGDFFPYSIANREEWTGFFTTKPTAKRICRKLQEYLRSASILCTISLSLEYAPDRNTSVLTKARRQLAVFQHHDAITGTSVKHVSQDYYNNLTDSLDKVLEYLLELSLTVIFRRKPEVIPKYTFHKYYTKLWPHVIVNPFRYAHVSHESTLMLFNSLPRARHVLVAFYCEKRNISIINALESQESFQISNSYEYFPPLYYVEFYVKLYPFGLHAYTVKMSGRNDAQPSHTKVLPHTPHTRKTVYLENHCLKLQFSPSTGYITSIYLKKEQLKLSVNISFYKYVPHEPSGLYLFNADNSNEDINSNNDIIISRGHLSSSVTVKHSKLYSHSISIIHRGDSANCDAIFIENHCTLVKAVNTEIIMNINSRISNSGTFYVDSNGFQMMERRHMKKMPTVFYPMTSQAFIQDRNLRLTLHSQQSFAVGSWHPGSLQILLDRNVNMDDNKGAEEGVTDNPPAVSSFIMHLEKRSVTRNMPSSDILNSYPSLRSIQLNSHFQAPVVISVSERAVKIADVDILSVKSLPCDLAVVNMRDLVSDAPDHRIAVTLHRWGYNDKQFPIPATCYRSWANVTFCDLTGKCPESVTETSLSFLHTHRTWTPSSIISMQPMDIKSYILMWRHR